MDPLSVTASVIAITGFACKSCQALISFFQGISGARGDILQICATLQSLESTMQSIKLLCIDPAIKQSITYNLTECLKECFSELEIADAKCRKARMLIHKGKVQSSWARLRWYLSAESWLEKFFARIQTYQMIISLEWSILHTYVSTLS